MTALVRVVGAGAVGARVARGVLAAAQDVVVQIDDANGAVAASLVGQLGERARVGTGEGLPAVAVLTEPAPHTALAARLVTAGVAVVSSVDDLDDVRALVELGSVARRLGVPLVVGAAMSPGLSGLMARQLAARLDEFDEIHVAVHGTGGPACARQHHDALAGAALNWQDGSWVERPGGSGRELCWFPDPLGAKDCYRARLADPALLVRAFPGVRRVSARLSATRRDRLTARLPMLTPPHAEGGLGGLRVEVRGACGGERVTLVAGIAERTAVAAAHVATLFALEALESRLPAGAVLPGAEDLDATRLLDRLDAAGMALREFVGTESRTGW